MYRGEGETQRGRAYGLKGLNRYIKNPDFRKLKKIMRLRYLKFIDL